MLKEFKKAFTLAEVLIVIGIIGVVAALTLPNLNHATGDKERVTKVKKIYAALTEAFDRAQAIYGPFDTWYDNGCKPRECLPKRITEFMKISKECGLEVDQGCFTPGNSKSLSGSEDANLDSYDSYYKVVTADGMSLGISDNIYGSRIVLISVDIDGPNKGSYTNGKDLFKFTIDNSLLYPNGSNADYSDPYSKYQLTSGYYAAGWIIENDNADYLKIDSTGKCKDSNIILDGVTNTSCH